MKLSKFACVAALIASLSGSFGCATSTYRKLDLPPEQVAVVTGTVSNFRLIGTDKRVRFLEVDGEQQYRGTNQGYPTKLDLLPGKHKMLIEYSIYVDSSFYERGELPLEAEVLAGKQYKVELVHEGPEGWRATLVEEAARLPQTDEEKAAAAKSRND
jgi:hypothetical protein